MTAKNDYVITQIAPKKYALVKVTSNKNGVVSGILEAGAHIESLRTALDLKAQDIVLNLGPDPHAGTVYGIDVGRRYRGHKTIEHFGDVHFFYKPKKETWKNIEIAFKRVYKVLSKLGLNKALEDANLIWELEPANKQKYAGVYFRSRKETVPHRIAFRPEVMTPSDYIYVIAHEFAHHIDYEYIQGTPALYTKWLALYAMTVKSTTISRKELRAHLDGLLKSGETVMNYLKTLDEEEAIQFRKILKIIRTFHRFKPHDLDLLLASEQKSSIEEVWPQNDIPDRDLDPVVSEYATTNVKELFAEAFAFHVTGKTLPKRVLKLLERSIAYASKTPARN